MNAKTFKDIQRYFKGKTAKNCKLSVTDKKIILECESDKLIIPISSVAKNKSKSKGNRGENEVAKLLSEWWGKEGSFHRAAGSGSRFTLFKKDSREQPGDLVVPEEFNFIVEIKNCEQFEIDAWLLSKSGLSFIDKAIQQCCEYADGTPKRPMIIGKKNFVEWLVIVPFDHKTLYWLDTFLKDKVYFVKRDKWLAFFLTDMLSADTGVISL